MLERKTSISERRPSVSSERRASSAGSGYESSESLSGRGFNSLNNEEPPIVFVIEPSKSLFCAIHSGLLHTPVILATCGHTFCRSCITKHLEKESSCPVDKVSVPTNVNLVPNLAVEGQIADLLVHCRFGLRRKHKKWMVDKKGCPEQLRLSQREEHETTCTFASYPCPYCDCSPMKKFELEEHMKTCKKIPCPHKKYGCSFEGIKEEIEVHKSSCMFESIKDYIVTTDNRIIELERQIQTIQTENQTLLQSLSQLKLNCEESKAEMNTRQNRLEATIVYLTNSIEDLKKVHKAVEQPTPASGKHEIRNTDQGEPAGGPPREVRSYGTFTGHTGPVWALAIGDGLLMSGSSDSTIKVWDLTTSKCKRTLSGHEGIVHAVAVRGEHVISGSSDNKIKIWKHTTGKCIQTLGDHENTVCALVMGAQLFSGSYQEIKMWDPEKYELLGTLSGHNHWVRAIALSNGGDTLYSGSHNSIKIWDLATQQCTGNITTHCGSIYSLCVVGNRLFAGTYENVIQVWDLDSQQLISSLRGHHGAVYALSMSGNRLFSGSYDSTIKVWDLEKMQYFQTLQRHTSSVEALVSSNGFTYSGSADALIKIWR